MAATRPLSVTRSARTASAMPVASSISVFRCSICLLYCSSESQMASLKLSMVTKFGKKGRTSSIFSRPSASFSRSTACLMAPVWRAAWSGPSASEPCCWTTWRAMASHKRRRVLLGLTAATVLPPIPLSGPPRIRSSSGASLATALARLRLSWAHATRTASVCMPSSHSSLTVALSLFCSWARRSAYLGSYSGAPEALRARAR
mmetsp:Transcript_1870/g.4758  ORF Transcript_1870/g.4758 Transcript_1870/m.4758 type:complete len:203 (-) Transcript_1870:2671-3279(-)